MADLAVTVAHVFGAVFLHRFLEHGVTDREMFLSALTQATVFRSKRLRVSMSQILSFQIDGKYLLIESAKRPKYLCPIGGVVRYFPCAIQELEGVIGFEHQLEKEERYDLRGFLTGRSFALFLRWYASGKGREQHALAREIEEEFGEIGIPEISSYVRRPEFIRERLVHEGPKDPNAKGESVYRQFEVCSFQEECHLTKRLANFMREKAGSHPQLVLADIAEIRKGRTNNGTFAISDSSGYVFGHRAEGIPAPPLIVGL